MIINNNDEIDLLALCRVLWKNILAIALVGVILGTVAFGFSAFCITPTYQATASMYVNNSSFTFGATNFSISNSELVASNTLVSTYMYILNSRTTMEDVIAESGVAYTSDALKGMVSTKAVNNTGAFEITVTSTNPAEAELIANTIAKVLPDRIAEIVDGSAVRIVDYAIIPAHRSGPSLLKNTVAGMVIGGLLSAVWVVLHSLIKERGNVLIQSADELRVLYPDIRVLSVIPDMRISEKKYGYYSSYYGPTEAANKGGR